MVNSCMYCKKLFSHFPIFMILYVYISIYYSKIIYFFILGSAVFYLDWSQPKRFLGLGISLTISSTVSSGHSILCLAMLNFHLPGAAGSLRLISSSSSSVSVNSPSLEFQVYYLFMPRGLNAKYAAKERAIMPAFCTIDGFKVRTIFVILRN